MPSDQELRKKWESQKVSAQGMLDAAPAGGKGTYLRLLDGLKFFVPEKNKTYKVRFMPWHAGAGNPSGAKGIYVVNRYIPVHRNVGPNDETFVCSARAFGKPCAGCEEFLRLRAEGADWDKVLKNIKFKDRELWFLTVLDEPKSLYVWDESIHLFGEKFRMKCRKKKDWMDFAHPINGCVVEIDAVEKKMGKSTCTDCSQSIEIEKADEPLDEFFLKAIEKYCIDDMVVETPYEKLRKLFRQTGGASVGETAVTTNSNSSGRTSYAGKPKGKDENEDEEEEEEAQIEEEEAEVEEEEIEEEEETAAEEEAEIEEEEVEEEEEEIKTPPPKIKATRKGGKK